LQKLYTKFKPTIDNYTVVNQEIEEKKKKFYQNVTLLDVPGNENL
jgi:hypothetical protein